MIDVLRHKEEKEKLENFKKITKKYLDFEIGTLENLDDWLEFSDIDIFKVLDQDSSKPDIWILKKTEFKRFIKEIKSKEQELKILKSDLQLQLELAIPNLETMLEIKEKEAKIMFCEEVIKQIDSKELNIFFLSELKKNETEELFIFEINANQLGTKNYFQHFFETFDSKKEKKFNKFDLETILDANQELKEKYENLKETKTCFDKIITKVIQRIQREELATKDSSFGMKVAELAYLNIDLQCLIKTLDKIKNLRIREVRELNHLITSKPVELIANNLLGIINETIENLPEKTKKLMQEVTRKETLNLLGYEIEFDEINEN